jgi:hypothetical protein
MKRKTVCPMTQLMEYETSDPKEGLMEKLDTETGHLFVSQMDLNFLSSK